MINPAAETFGAEVSVRQAADSALGLLRAGQDPISISREEFVAFVLGVVEKVRSQSLKEGSLYAIHVREPTDFYLEDSERPHPFVPGLEVGSLLGGDLAESIPSVVEASLRALSNNSNLVEVSLGHVLNDRRLLLFRFVRR